MYCLLQTDVRKVLRSESGLHNLCSFWLSRQWPKPSFVFHSICGEKQAANSSCSSGPFLDILAQFWKNCTFPVPDLFRTASRFSKIEFILFEITRTNIRAVSWSVACEPIYCKLIPQNFLVSWSVVNCLWNNLLVLVTLIFSCFPKDLPWLLSVIAVSSTCGNSILTFLQGRPAVAAMWQEAGLDWRMFPHAASVDSFLKKNDLTWLQVNFFIWTFYLNSAHCWKHIIEVIVNLCVCTASMRVRMHELTLILAVSKNHLWTNFSSSTPTPSKN